MGAVFAEIIAAAPGYESSNRTHLAAMTPLQPLLTFCCVHSE